MPGKLVSTDSIGERLAMATPFHWLKPCSASSYPASSNGAAGNCSGLHLISCIASTSTSSRTIQSTTRSTRVRIELTFQVAMRMQQA